MSDSYEQVLARLRERTAFVCLDVEPPRDAPIKQLLAFLFEPAPGEQHPTRPHGHAVRLPVTPEQARELLDAGADWKGPAHMRATIFPA